MPAPAPVDLAHGDLTIDFCDDPAYLALLDPGRYQKDLPDWDLDTLSARVLEQMAAGHLFAWGCPGDSLRLRITTRPRPVPDAVATIRSVLETDGTLCLAGYTSLTMCAQFAKHAFPQPGDALATIVPGRYAITVHRRYHHTPGHDAPDQPLPAGDHVIVELTPSDGEPARFSTIPWTPWPGG